MIKANHDRVNGWNIFHQYLMTDADDDRPMLMVFDTCTDFIRTIPCLVPDPHRPEDVDSTLEDHIADEARYALMSSFAKNPNNALHRQPGQWNFHRNVGQGWDPLA
jgi:hypothetical protein